MRSFEVLRHPSQDQSSQLGPLRACLGPRPIAKGTHLETLWGPLVPVCGKAPWTDASVSKILATYMLISLWISAFCHFTFTFHLLAFSHLTSCPVSLCGAIWRQSQKLPSGKAPRRPERHLAAAGQTTSTELLRLDPMVPDQENGYMILFFIEWNTSCLAGVELKS